MKKYRVLTLVASLVMGIYGTAMAADASDIKFDGSLSVQYRSQRDENFANGNPSLTRNGLKTTLELDVEKNLVQNLSLYARFTNEWFKSSFGDFGADYVGDRSNNGAVDALGVKYKNAGYTYTLGTQVITLGGGLIYDNGFVGKHSQPEAVTINGKVGATDVTLIAAQTYYQTGIANDKFYVLQGTYAVNDKTNIGAMFTHVAYGASTVSLYALPTANLNYYSLYGSFKITDKLTGSAEVVKSSAASDNKAYLGMLKYQIDDKNSLGVGYYRAEDYSDIVDYNAGDMTGSPDTNGQGYIVRWSTKLAKNVSFSLADWQHNKIKSSSLIAGGTDRNRFNATLCVTF
jgi:hypothetical protein